MIEAQCPVCNGKCTNEIKNVGTVPCFTCRSRGYLLLPPLPLRPIFRKEETK